MNRIPLQVVGGFLGVGKTTLVRKLVAARAGVERAAVIVNDFGEAGIDAAVLGPGMKVAAIPGGCVCCTAPEGLVEALRSLLADGGVDRVFIELSGLSRPQDVVDMLARSDLAAILDRRPTLVLVDPGATGDDPLRREQIEAGEILVVTNVDRHPRAQIDAAARDLRLRWPPPIVVECAIGTIPPEILDESLPIRGSSHDHGHDHAPSTVGFVARSGVAPPSRVVGLDGLLAGLGADKGIERFKGIFHTDLGWFRVDVASGRVSTTPTAWRQDSRWDVIARADEVLDRVATLVRDAVPRARGPGTGVRITGVAGRSVEFGREVLAALPGQVADVATVVPGRAGEGVWLRDVLAAAELTADSEVVFAAADGLTTAPVRVGDVGDAVLVFARRGEPLTGAEGGPFRLLAAGRSPCGNVKGLVGIRAIDAP